MKFGHMQAGRQAGMSVCLCLCPFYPIYWSYSFRNNLLDFKCQVIYLFRFRKSGGENVNPIFIFIYLVYIWSVIITIVFD